MNSFMLPFYQIKFTDARMGSGFWNGNRERLRKSLSLLPRQFRKNPLMDFAADFDWGLENYLFHLRAFRQDQWLARRLGKIEILQQVS
jgi:hypothetical protein